MMYSVFTYYYEVSHKTAQAHGTVKAASKDAAIKQIKKLYPKASLKSIHLTKTD